MQEQEEKNEEVLSIRGKNVSTTIRDVSHLGLVIEQNSTLETEGKFEGSGYSTVTVHMKPDGTSQYEQRGFVTTPKGELVTLRGRGTGTSAGQTSNWEGEVEFVTQSSKLASLNDTTYSFKGTGDMAEGEFRGSVLEFG